MKSIIDWFKLIIICYQLYLNYILIINKLYINCILIDMRNKQTCDIEISMYVSIFIFAFHTINQVDIIGVESVQQTDVITNFH